MYTNIKWFKGSNYYSVRGWLEKNGYKKSGNYGYYNADKSKGWQEFDSGTEQIIIKCNIIRNPNTNHLQCTTVYDYEVNIYDNKNVNNCMNNINEKFKIFEGLESEIETIVKEEKFPNHTSYTVMSKLGIQTMINHTNDESEIEEIKKRQADILIKQANPNEYAKEKEKLANEEANKKRQITKYLNTLSNLNLRYNKLNRELNQELQELEYGDEYYVQCAHDGKDFFQTEYAKKNYSYILDIMNDLNQIESKKSEIEEKLQELGYQEPEGSVNNRRLKKW